MATAMLDSAPNFFILQLVFSFDCTGYCPLSSPTGQVCLHFSCQTPRLTHQQTVNSLQMHCQAVISTNASQFGADPNFSDFTTSQIGRDQVSQRGKQRYCKARSWGNPLWPFSFVLSQTSNLWKQCYISKQALYQQQKLALKWKTCSIYANRRGKKILLKIMSGNETKLENTTGLIHKKTSTIKPCESYFPFPEPLK